MLASSALLAVAATLFTQVAAHGYVPQLKIGSQYVAGWDISKGMIMDYLILY